MKLIFLGTRGYIDAANDLHRRHACLEIRRGGRRVIIDCGEDWAGEIGRLAPDAILLTHGHPDHAFGLRAGAPCPVFATEETWKAIRRFPIAQRRTIRPRERWLLHGCDIEAFPVVHSLRAPAVGYRVTADGTAFFYVPDVVAIRDRRAALARAALYIGDGATLLRSMVRVPRAPGGAREGMRIGHIPILRQLDWCRREGVPRAIFTHCGRGIVAGDEVLVAQRIAAWARTRALEASIAHDGDAVALRAPAPRA